MTFVPEGVWFRGFHHREEAARGLDSESDLLATVTFEADVAPGARVAIRLSVDGPSRTGPPRKPRSSRPLRATRGCRSEPARAGAARSCGSSSGPRTSSSSGGTCRCVSGDAPAPATTSIIAGYHWFGDWGRDTMIALPGLLLATERPDEAASVLRSYARLVRARAAPEQPAGAGRGAARLQHRRCRPLVRAGRPRVDAAFGADARRGAAARGGRHRQCLHGRHRLRDRRRPGRRPAAGRGGGPAADLDGRAGRRPRGDAADRQAGRDQRPLVQRAALARRLAGGLGPRWIGAVSRRRGTRACVVLCALLGSGPRPPCGCRRRAGRRRLDPAAEPDPRAVPARAAPRPNRGDGGARGGRARPGHHLRAADARAERPAYHGTYGGSREERDGAYHQGPAWTWLLGPFAEAWARLRDRTEALEMLEAVSFHLRDAGLGSISELTDGDPPHRPRGAIAQAWSVAEVLRVWRALGGA